MKKITFALLSTALTAGLLAGCGGGKETESPAPTATPSPTASAPAGSETAQYKDGKYYAEAAEFASSGWKEAVALTVEGGKITDVYWTALNKDGGIDKRVYSEQGKYGMKAGGASSEWHEQAEKAEQYLIQIQDPTAIELNAEGKTDAIAGVTIHVNGLFDLAKQALEAGPVEVGPYKDGNYHAEQADFGSSGWKSTVDLTVLNGKIYAVRWSGVNANGEDKFEFSKEGKYGMKEKGNATAEWHEQALKAEQYLLEKQDPAAIVLNEDGKTDAIAGVTINLSEFVELASKALEQAK